MFSTIKPNNANVVFSKQMFGNVGALTESVKQSEALGDLANSFHTDFKKHMTGLNNVLNAVLQDQDFLGLLEQDKKTEFTKAVGVFQKTYQKLESSNVITKCEKIYQRIEALRDSLGGCNDLIWQGLCACLNRIVFNLKLIVKNLSSLKL